MYDIKMVGLTLVAAFLLSAVFTYVLIPVITKLKMGQNIREEGPESHQVKAGTPSMGGIAIILGTIIAALLFGTRNADMAVILAAFVAFGLLGFLDDFVKVARKQNLGLRAWQKLVLQIAIAAGVAAYQAATADHGTALYVPLLHLHFDIGMLYIPFVAFVVVAMVNSVNLTDGLDGLAAGVSTIVAVFFFFAALKFQAVAGGMFSIALAGACLGFLVFNRHPARIFMGDTGSLALGGGLAAAAIIMNLELILPVAGLLFVLEALSVIIQVVSFKTRGKRVFKMAPLHHHFELSGYKETQVVYMFWGFTLLCCLVAAVIL